MRCNKVDCVMVGSPASAGLQTPQVTTSGHRQSSTFCEIEINEWRCRLFVPWSNVLHHLRRMFVTDGQKGKTFEFMVLHLHLILMLWHI
jgi:hypothetical protein